MGLVLLTNKISWMRQTQRNEKYYILQNLKLRYPFKYIYWIKTRDHNYKMILLGHYNIEKVFTGMVTRHFYSAFNHQQIQKCELDD